MSFWSQFMCNFLKGRRVPLKVMIFFRFVLLIGTTRIIRFLHGYAIPPSRPSPICLVVLMMLSLLGICWPSMAHIMSTLPGICYPSVTLHLMGQGNISSWLNDKSSKKLPIYQRFFCPSPFHPRSN